MRDIKFRCWDFGEKKMYYEDCNCKCRNAPTMQFIGLCAKGGKKIYEGDILRRFWDFKTNRGTHRRGDELLVVEWCDQTAQWSVSWHDTQTITKLGKYVKVVGNIYSTPELLEQST